MAYAQANLWVLLGLGLAGVLIMTKKLKKAVKADFGVFVERLQLLPPPPLPPPKAPHPLAGLTFPVSDVISGENKHYGTPTNPAAPGRTPGGSSSGAAVAVAANLVDFSLGWFAKDPNILCRVGHVLLQVPYTVQRNPRSIVVADDCFQLLTSSADWVSQAVVKFFEKLF